MLGRNEKRTRDMMYYQAIRTVTDIPPSRSSKNCDMQFANTDRDKENYSIDAYTETHNTYLLYAPVHSCTPIDYHTYLAQSSILSIGVGSIICKGLIPHAVFISLVNYYNE